MALFAKEIYQLAALLLAYPDEAWFFPEIDEAAQYLYKICDEDEAYALLLQAAEAFLQATGPSLARTYVETFDFQETCALYLTAHEFGEERERGTALVELRQLLLRAGFSENAGELPDFLPLVLEFLAEKPEEFRAAELEARLERVCRQIAAHLPAGSPYQNVFLALLRVLPKDGEINVPSGHGVIEQDVPYPLVFD